MSYVKDVVQEMRNEGFSDDYIQDWVAIFSETGLDMRDMPDGIDVDAFLDAYYSEDIDDLMDFM